MARADGQGMRPGIAMALCVAFAALAGVGLWCAGRHDLAPVPPAPSPAAVLAPADDQQAALVLDEDDRIEVAVFGRRPSRPPHGPATLILPAAPAPYALDALITAGAARRVDPTTVDVLRPVVVAPGAHLDVEAPGTTLRLLDGPGGFASLVGWKGAITLAGTAAAPLTLTSWDPAKNAPDLDPHDGRPYVRAIGTDLQLRFVHTAALGFWSGRTGGIALTGLAEAPATGTITDTQVLGDHYGLFTADLDKLTVTHCAFRHSELAGVLLHRGTTGVTVAESTAERNGGDGIVADRGSQAVALHQVSVSGNAGDGVRFDGRPLAEDAGPAGASNVSHRDFRIDGSVVRANRDEGIRAVDADQLVIAANEVVGHRDGILVTGRSAGAQITDNHVVGAVTAAIALRGGPTDALVEGNRTERAALGIQVRDARADLRDNAVTAATSHGLSIVGAASGTTAEGNTLAGRVRAPSTSSASPPARSSGSGSTTTTAGSCRCRSTTTSPGSCATIPCCRCGRWCCCCPSP